MATEQVMTRAWLWHGTLSWPARRQADRCKFALLQLSDWFNYEVHSFGSANHKLPLGAYCAQIQLDARAQASGHLGGHCLLFFIARYTPFPFSSPLSCLLAPFYHYHHLPFINSPSPPSFSLHDLVLLLPLKSYAFALQLL